MEKGIDDHGGAGDGDVGDDDGDVGGGAACDDDDTTMATMTTTTAIAILQRPSYRFAF